MRIAFMSIYGLGVALALGCGACVAGSPADVTPDPARDSCFLPTQQGTDSRISVALLEAIHPHRAPVPRTASERLVFRHLYQGLVSVACDGRVQAGLAGRWEQLNGGRIWHFYLRDGARFWDGSTVTARTVAESWARGDGAKRLASLRLGTVKVDAVGERTLRIVTARPEPRLPWLVAGPELALVKPGPTGDWPLGTGPFRLVGRGTAAGNTSASWVAEAFSPAAPSGLSIEFQSARGLDPRDVIEMRPGAHVLVTSDSRAVDFAGARPGFRAEPLPWDRVYVLMVTRRTESRAAPRPRTAELGPGDEFKASLARDAVRSAARAARARYWWDGWKRCDGNGFTAMTEMGGPPTRATRLVYQAGDGTAAQLSERLVAVLGSPRRSAAGDRLAELIWGSSAIRPGATARGLPLHEFIAAVRTGSEGAYVLALPTAVLDVCQAIEDLTSGEGVLAGLDSGLLPVVLPLVETRKHVLVRDGTPSMIVDWDAVPVIGGRDGRGGQGGR